MTSSLIYYDSSFEMGGVDMKSTIMFTLKMTLGASCGVVLILMIGTGFGFRSTEAASFKDILFLSERDRIYFDDTWCRALVGDDRMCSVISNPQDVEVKIKSDLGDVTAITIIPKWYSYIFGGHYLWADKVTVLVGNREEKEKWEMWLLGQKRRRIETMRHNYKKVHPW